MLDALFPRTKQRVLALLFGQAERAFATGELIRLVRGGSGAVQRELERLATSGLILVSGERTQKRFIANRDSPLFEELRRIVEKTSGVQGILESALAPLASAIDVAILYGSVAKGSDNGTSDIDLLIVTDSLRLEEIFAALEPVELRLGRRVSPTVYTKDEFLRRRKAKHPFLTKVLSGKHAVILGTTDGVGTR